MKKIISMILVIALFASLAVGVSAKGTGHAGHGPSHKVEDFVEHAFIPGKTEPGEICADFNNPNNKWFLVDEKGNNILDENGEPVVLSNQEACDFEYRRSADMTKILKETTEGLSFSRVNCEEAISYDEMKAAVEEWNAANADHEIKHMTVYFQRNLAFDGEGEAQVALKLWPAGKKNSVVVLGEFDGVWQILTVTEVGTDEATANVTGAESFAVCMTW